MTNTIILTGAICPAFPVRRKNPYIRLLDYLCSIRRWLDVSSLDHVIFCDASGSQIPEDVFSSEKFESLSFDVSNLARIYEAGRGEAETIRFVLEKSRKKIETFYKCTGRLFIQNFEEIRNEISRKVEMDIHLRTWMMGTCMKELADTRFFWMKSEAYRRWICPRIGELRGVTFQGYFIESLFHEYYYIASSFSQPIFTGHCGHADFVYEREFTEEEMDKANEIVDKFGISRFFNIGHQSSSVNKRKNF